EGAVPFRVLVVRDPAAGGAGPADRTGR
ncbi:methyltransferase, partial [Clavibacter michiganensis subsp. insidiosus]